MHSLILVRHEISLGNLSHTYAGKEVGLAPRGKVRTKMDRVIFNTIKLTNPIFIASEYKRAIQTAKYVLKREDYNKLKITGLVNELDIGKLVGKTFKESLALYGSELDGWLKDPNKCPPPGGESYQMAFKRVKKLMKFWKKYKGDVVVFSHQGFIQCVFGYYSNKKNIKRLRLINGAISILI